MFRFTIRDVLWLTVVVALGVFAGVQRRDAREVAAANAKLVAQAEELTEQLKNAQWWADKLYPSGLIGPAEQRESFERERQRAQRELAKQLDELIAADGAIAPIPPTTTPLGSGSPPESPVPVPKEPQE